MRPYHRLNLSEREEICFALVLGKSISWIAKNLGRETSTINREIERSGTDRYSYRAGDAHRRSIRSVRRRRLGKRKLLMNPKLLDKVEALLRKRWSPRQIVKRLRKEYPNDQTMRISHEAIYSYLYVMPKRKLKEELLGCLRRRHKRRRKKGAQTFSAPMEDMIFIDERPKEAEDRTVPGHWEGDLLMGRNRQSFLGALVERKTRFLLLVKLKNKSAEEVRRAFAQKVKHLPEQLRRTLTYDQGREMAEHKLFAQETQMKVYFCHPRSPWERGTCENTNGLIRDFFPKGTDFNKVSLEEIQKVEWLLNDRPRGTLDWDKPCEAFDKVLR